MVTMESPNKLVGFGEKDGDDLEVHWDSVGQHFGQRCRQPSQVWPHTEQPYFKETSLSVSALL